MCFLRGMWTQSEHFQVDRIHLTFFEFLLETEVFLLDTEGFTDFFLILRCSGPQIILPTQQRNNKNSENSQLPQSWCKSTSPNLRLFAPNMSPVFGDQSPLLRGYKLDNMTLGMPLAPGVPHAVSALEVLYWFCQIFSCPGAVEWNSEGCCLRAEFFHTL